MKDLHAKAIFEDDSNQTAISLADALRSLADWAEECGIFDLLFLQKQSIAGSSLYTAASASAERVAQVTDVLVKGGLLETRKPGKIVSTIMVHRNPHLGLVDDFPEPVLPLLIATDWPDVQLSQRKDFDGRNMVFPLHYESFALVERLLLFRQERPLTQCDCLDMYCGSGVLGIYASRIGVRSVTFADVNTRALAFAKLNVALCGVPCAYFVKTNLFEGFAESKKWDLILANPPFEPVPSAEVSKYFLHSGGGPDGQSETRRFLEAAPARLMPGGLIATVDFMLSNSPDNWEVHFQSLLDEWIRPPFRGKLVLFDQARLRDFWQRYEHLDIDSDGKLLLENLQKGNNSLLLCTLEVSERFPLHQVFPKSLPAPVYWQNPLRWPLPCGVSLKDIQRWKTTCQKWEAEKIAEDSAIAAERIGNQISEGYWDFSQALDSDNPRYSSVASATVRGALYEALDDASNLLLLGMLVPAHAILIIWANPRSRDQAKTKCFWFPGPSERLMKNRRKLRTFETSRRITVEALEEDVCAEKLGELTRKENRLIIRFAVLAAPNARSRRAESDWLTAYGQITDVRLLISGEDTEAFLCPGKSEVQVYYLALKLEPCDFTALRSAGLVWGKSWREHLRNQLFHFLRDKLTVLALPLILSARSIELDRAEYTRSLTRAFRHDFLNASLNIQLRMRRLARAHRPLTQEAAGDISARLLFLGKVLQILPYVLTTQDTLSRSDIEDCGSMLREMLDPLESWMDFEMIVEEIDPVAETRILPKSFRIIFAEMLRNAYEHSAVPKRAWLKVTAAPNSVRFEVANLAEPTQLSDCESAWRDVVSGDNKKADRQSDGGGLALAAQLMSTMGNFDVIVDSVNQRLVTSAVIKNITLRHD